MEYGLYIHLPYCRSLCPYCAFVKAPLHRAEPARLLRALEAEWARAREEDGLWLRPRTIYWGGGTPTALDVPTLEALLGWTRKEFDLGGVREWTVEANPEGLTREKLELLRAAGADRLSLGIQSLEPAVLRSLGRIHTAERALGAVSLARSAGFRNISADLMVSIPTETTEGFRRGVEALLALRISHVSAYALQVEEGTPLAVKVERGAVRVPGDDVAAERYEDLARILDGAGYRHYEVSSWALRGFESRHNQGYWTRRPYLGLGPGAHSFDGTARWRNEGDVIRYFERIEAGDLPREDRARLSEEEAAEETIMLGLRRARGLRRPVLERLAGGAVGAWAEWASLAGAVRLDPPGRVRPTGRGLLLAHEVSAELLARRGGTSPPRLDTPVAC